MKHHPDFADSLAAHRERRGDSRDRRQRVTDMADHEIDELRGFEWMRSHIPAQDTLVHFIPDGPRDARAGFNRQNPHLLLEALRKLAADAEAVEDRASEYGEILRAEGELAGP
ncbi:MAG TPA: hypothetical protein VKM72_32770 [Thermoanaerobaculia bacterium]|nr:hypothetical protein [Thermoanaerobaculia bacterium]